MNAAQDAALAAKSLVRLGEDSRRSVVTHGANGSFPPLLTSNPEPARAPARFIFQACAFCLDLGSKRAGSGPAKVSGPLRFCEVCRCRNSPRLLPTSHASGLLAFVRNPESGHSFFAPMTAEQRANLIEETRRDRAELRLALAQADELLRRAEAVWKQSRPQP